MKVKYRSHLISKDNNFFDASQVFRVFFQYPKLVYAAGKLRSIAQLAARLAMLDK